MDVIIINLILWIQYKEFLMKAIWQTAAILDFNRQEKFSDLWWANGSSAWTQSWTT